jgi:predicted nucleic acid-binding protein
VDAFDADVLIYAVAPGHELGRRIRGLFRPERLVEPAEATRIGSVLLLPELLSRPLRRQEHDEVMALVALLDAIDLRATDEPTAELAAQLGARYRLRAADAIHLATAVHAGADRFITNNAADFSKDIVEIDITYPSDLDEPLG